MGLGLTPSFWIFTASLGILGLEDPAHGSLADQGQNPAQVDQSPVVAAEQTKDGLEDFSVDHLVTGLERGALSFVESKNFAPFEGGNIGPITRLGSHEYQVSLRSDNDDALPEFWRRWFFFRLENLPTDRPVTITLVGAGQWAYYVPLFNEGDRPLEEKGWRHFSESSVEQPDPLTLRIRHRFKKDKAYVARFVPYGLTSLLSFLRKISSNPVVSLNIAGLSPEHRPIPVLSVGAHPSISKKTVFIHGRTHPGELGSSYLLEGFLEHLLESRDKSMKKLRENYRFEVLPLLNVDGVYAGNNRVTPGGINLEGKWYPPSQGVCSDQKALEQGIKTGNCFDLDEHKTPQEVLVWHRWIKNAVRGGAEPVMALNLHTSSVNPREGVFVFPHFGPLERGYREAEVRLFKSQQYFFERFSRHMGTPWFLPFPEDGGQYFLKKNLPETWWWNQFGSQVMALTIESTYGYVPGTRRWIMPQDLRRMGRAMARGIGDYLDNHSFVLPRSPSRSLAQEKKSDLVK